MERERESERVADGEKRMRGHTYTHTHTHKTVFLVARLSQNDFSRPIEWCNLLLDG